MADFSSEVKAILTVGTWTNYHALAKENPNVMEFNIKNMRGNPQGGVGLRESRAKRDQTYTGKTIREIQTGSIIVWSKSRTKRMALEDDIFDILKDSDDLYKLGAIIRKNFLDYYGTTITLERTMAP